MPSSRPCPFRLRERWATCTSASAQAATWPSVVKGPKGEHRQHIPEGLTFEEKDGQLTVSRPDDSKPVRAKHGLVRALIANQVHGVTEGFEKKLEIIGVGYRAAVKGKVLDLQLQFSHPVEYPIPDDVKIACCLIIKNS